jgi:hypothetical protein
MPEGTPNLYIFKVLNIGLTEEWSLIFYIGC